MKIRKVELQSIKGFKLGNAENIDKGTGCTVIICEDGAIAGVDVRGGAPATRETDLLRSENTVNTVNAVVISGGSAFGLEASSGVMRELSDRDIGYDTGFTKVPIVCAASLFDMNIGDTKAFPDVEMGRQSVRNAYEGKFDHGNRGAGTGASVGKFLGINRAMKSGLGTFACADDYLEVGAVVAVNAMGDIYNGAGNIVAGLRDEEGNQIYGSIKSLKPLVHNMQDKPETDEFSGFTGAVEDRTKNKEEIANAIKNAFNNKVKETEEPEAAQETAPPEEMVDVIDDASQLADLYTSEDMMVTGRFPRFTEITQEEVHHEQEFQSEPQIEIQPEPQAEPQIEIQSETQAEPQIEIQPEPQTEPQIEIQPEPEPYVEEDQDDQGYDITFNTTIGCLITNARLSKSQANKLAAILHDAYARAIKPVHSTMDGDTIFVLTTATQEVNFDAFAALATDVMQYAIIDAATSAKSAYGLPAACDIIK